MNSELPSNDPNMDENPSQTPEKIRDDQDSAVLDDHEASDDKPSHPLAWVVAIALSLFIAGIVPFMGEAGATSPFGQSYLPTLPLILLAAIAMVWNPIVKSLGPLSILAMRGRSLFLVAIFTYLIAGVASSGLSQSWSKTLLTGDFAQTQNRLNPARSADFENRKAELEPLNFYGLFASEEDIENKVGWPYMDAEGNRIIGQQEWSLESLASSRATGNEANQALISGLGSGNPQSLDSFFEPLPDGAGGESSPFDLAQSALGNSLPLVIFGIMLMLGIVAITAKQWTHNERLQHPLVQIPNSLSEGKLLRNKPFLITLAVVLLFWFYQISASYEWHPLPMIQTNPMIQMPDFHKLFGLDAPGGYATTIMEKNWNSISIFPFAIGIAFLLAIDVGFSVWGGFFFGVMITGWLYTFGIDVDFPKHGRLAGGGATMAMALVILYLGRFHYWRLLKAAVLLRPGANDPLGVWGVRVFLMGAIGAILVMTMYFGSFWSAVLAILLMTSFLLVIGRVIAESGLAAFQAAQTLSTVSVSMGFPLILPINGMLALLWMSSVMVEDTRANLTGYAVQGAAMAERAKHPPRLVFTIATVVAVCAAIIAVGAQLISVWTGEAGEIKAANMRLPNVYSAVQNPSSGGFLGSTIEQSSIAVGAILVFAVVGLRRIWYACPLHPIGLVVATSFPIFIIWGSLAIGWLAKIIVLRYGGAQLYKNLKPVAIGLILGDVLGFGMQMIFQLTIGGDSWRLWP